MPSPFERPVWALALALGLGCIPPTSPTPPSATIVEHDDPSPEADLPTLERTLAAALPGPPSRQPVRRCKLDHEGQCVYREHELPERNAFAFVPYTEHEAKLLGELAVYEQLASTGPTTRPIRYGHIVLRMQHNDFDAALPLLERYVLDRDSDVSAVWAADMLVDALVISMTREEPDNAAIERTLAWMDRLETLGLWQLAEAESLRASVPAIRVGARWRGAMAARQRGIAQFEASQAGQEPQSTEGFERCARDFVEIAALLPDADVARALWHAAECFEAGFEIGRAVAARSALIRRFPDSEYARDSLRYLAESHESFGDYEQAGKQYFEFGQRYPKDEHAADALQSAYRFSLAFDAERAQAALELWLTLYAKKDPARAAQIRWLSRPDSPRELAEFAEGYLEIHGKKWTVGKLLASITLASSTWAEGCTERLDDGLCVARKPKPSAAACTLSGTGSPAIRARTRTTVTAVRQQLDPLLRWLQRAEFPIEDREQEAAVHEAIASANFLAIELRLEAYLIAGPKAANAHDVAAQLDAAYLEVAALGQLDYAIRAHARRALVWQVLIDASWRTSTAGVCEPRDERAEEDRRLAIVAYEACLELAMREQAFFSAASGCETALATIDPEQHPALDELFGEPSAGSVEMRAAGVQSAF